MHTTAFVTPTPALPSGEVDNRSAYVSFGLAYVLGHGAAALSRGTDPVLTMPAWLPMALLAAGLVAGTILSTLAATRAQRGVSKPEALTGKLLGAAWVTGFVVGLLYVAEGAVRRNALHYVLGTWLAMVSTASLFLGTPGLFTMLAVAGGGAYAVAAVLERRRLLAVRSTGTQ
jgi:hypothetical protein